MTNRIENKIKVLGEKTEVDKFINKFKEKPFTCFIPIPEILIKYDDYVTRQDIEKHLTKKYNISSQAIYSNKEIKQKLILTIQKKLSKSKRRDEMDEIIYNCLNQTGYLHWKDFIQDKWGIDHMVYFSDVKTKGNILLFNTKQPPLNFFANVAKQSNLTFQIRCKHIGKLVAIQNILFTACSEYLINSQGIKKTKDTNDIYLEELAKIRLKKFKEKKFSTSKF